MNPTEILHTVLGRWQAGIAAHDPAAVAAAFTEDAIFQGLQPYSVGRDGVAAYYAAQPPGMTVAYRIHETRRLAGGVVLGYLTAVFSFTDRPSRELRLGVVAQRIADEWLIAHYQVSRPD